MTTDTDLTPASDFDGAMFEDIERGGLWLRVACFDNLGATVDRYTVLVEQDLPWRDPEDGEHEPERWSFLSSSHPTHPQGVGMTDDGHAYDESPGNYVTSYNDLPQEVQSSVWRIASSMWMPTPTGSALLVYDMDRQRWVVDRFYFRKG